MEMIIGGAFQGKGDFAKSNHPDIKWQQGESLDENGLLAAEGILDFQEYIRAELKNGHDVSGLAEKIIKEDAPSRMDTTLALLDPIFEKTPALALDQCKKVVQAMGETVQENLQMAIELSVRYDEKLFEKVING